MAKRKSVLSPEEQEVLRQSELVWEMSDSKGWREVMLPFLMDKLNQSFPDPSKFTKEEEFVYAAKVSSIFKKVVAEILGWVDANVTQAKSLSAREKGNIPDPFAIGSTLGKE